MKRLIAFLLLSVPAVAQSIQPAIHEVGIFPSPDGKYVAHVYETLGEVRNLQVYVNGTDPTHGKGLLRFPETDIWGVEWAPGHGHLLVYGEAGITGRPSIGSWSGQPKVKRVVAAPDGDEIFDLRGISTDGKIVHYDDRRGGRAIPRTARLTAGGG
jgi:hypothetical protein